MTQTRRGATSLKDIVSIPRVCGCDWHRAMVTTDTCQQLLDRYLIPRAPASDNSWINLRSVALSSVSFHGPLAVTLLSPWSPGPWSGTGSHSCLQWSLQLEVKMASGNTNVIFTVLSPSKVSWAFFFSQEKAEKPDKQQCPSGYSGSTSLASQSHARPPPFSLLSLNRDSLALDPRPHLRGV